MIILFKFNKFILIFLSNRLMKFLKIKKTYFRKGYKIKKILRLKLIKLKLM